MCIGSCLCIFAATKNLLQPWLQKIPFSLTAKKNVFLIIMPIVSGPFSVDKLEGN